MYYMNEQRSNNGQLQEGGRAGQQDSRKEATACCTQGGLGWTLSWLSVLRARVHCCGRGLRSHWQHSELASVKQPTASVSYFSIKNGNGDILQIRAAHQAGSTGGGATTLVSSK